MVQKSPYVVYTDGSYLGKKRGSIGGWAAVIVYGGVTTELSGALDNCTNNRAEMMGVIKALQSIATGSNVYLYTDSQYVQKGISIWMHAWKRRDWLTLENKPIANRDLWVTMDAESVRHMISWHWVRGHDGDPHNERCDVLARAAAEQRWSFSGQYDKEQV